MAKKPKAPKTVETLTHEEARRRNIPTAAYQSVMQEEQQNPVRVAYERRNRDLDPQLVWRGKDEQDWSDLVVQAPPLYIQEKVHPKVLVDDLLRRTEADEKAADPQPDLFADFNGLADEAATTEFYQYDARSSPNFSVISSKTAHPPPPPAAAAAHPLMRATFPSSRSTHGASLSASSPSSSMFR